jgi:8-amino-7-oxononanoate synthase
MGNSQASKEQLVARQIPSPVADAASCRPTAFVGSESLPRLLRRRAQENPDKVIYAFLADGEQIDAQLSYDDLYQQAQKIADRLPVERADSRVLIIFPPGPDYIVALFACLLRGVIAVPVYPPGANENSLQPLRHIIADCGATLALSSPIYQKLLADRLPSADYALSVFTLEQILDEPCQTHALTEISDTQSIALLQYTSGSTGNPKGVVLRHEQIIANLAIIRERFGLHQHSRGVIWLPPYHDMGLIGGIFEPLYADFPVRLMPSSVFIRRPWLWLEAISRFRADVSGAPNFAYDLCVDKIDRFDRLPDLSSWRVAFNGAEPVRRRTLERFASAFELCGFRASAFYPCYGMAEATLFVSGAALSVATENTEAVSCGTLAPGFSLRIVEPGGTRPLAEGETGEILLRGTCVTSGYWNRQQNQERFVDLHGERYLRTGDLGYLRHNALTIAGRLKDIIIIRGKNYAAEDLEACARAADAALASSRIAGIAGTMEAATTESLLLVVEAAGTPVATDFERLVAAMQRELNAVHGIAAEQVIFVRPRTIPLTRSGKIRRQECRARLARGELPSIHTWRRTTPHPPAMATDVPRLAEAATTAQDIQLTRLGLPVTGGEDTFASLGMDSLQAAELATWLEEQLPFPLPEGVLAEHAHMGSLAAILGRKLQIHQLTEGTDASQRQWLLADDSKLQVATDEPPAANYRIEHFPEIVDARARLQALQTVETPNPYFSLHEGEAGAVTRIAGQQFLNFSANNYLGLSNDPQVKAAVYEAVQHYGTSVSAARIVSGERPLLQDLEREIADFIGVDAALAFVGGNQANVTTIGHLLTAEDAVFYDEYSHDSALQGIKLAGCASHPFRHNDHRMLDGLLQRLRGRYRRALIFIEGVYSMDGDIPELAAFIEVKQRAKALLMVDECLSIGVLGETGRGIAEQQGIAPGEVDIWMGGISKALASCGGYIAGSRTLIDYLRYTAPGFVFTTGMSPANAAAALAALRILREEPQRLGRLRQLIGHFASALRAAEFDIGISGQTPAIPVMIGAEDACLAMYALLRNQGINVQPILYPAVPRNKARLRFFVTYLHNEEQLDFTVQALMAARKTLSEAAS